MLQRILRRRFAVTAENDGQHAVQLLDQPASFDLVICDLMMSPLTGMEVYREATRRRPELQSRFLLMTGGAYLPPVEQFLAQWPYSVLLKPFSSTDVDR